MRYLLILAILTFHLWAYAQESPCGRSVAGRVLDIDTNEPLPFATVSIAGTSSGTITNEDGFFTLTDICDEEIDLEVRFLGYKSIVHHHDFHHPSPIIFMASDAALLEGIVVEAALNQHDLKTLDPLTIEVDKLDAIGSNAGDLFASASGVSTLKTGQNIVKPIVHGLHSNRVLVINNGVRHAYQAWGIDHGIEIDPSQVERIQLIKGASTVRYGSDALGGVILFNAPSPTYATPINGSMTSGFQSNGKAISGELSLNQGFERVAWRMSLSGTKLGDLKAANYQLTNTGKEDIGFTFGGRFHLPSIDIDVFYSHFQQELGILRGSVNGNLTDLAQAIGASTPNQTMDFSYDIQNPRQETTHDLVKLASSMFIGEQQFDFQYAFQRNRRSEFDLRRGSNNERPAIDLALLSHSIDLDWDHPSKGAWAGTLGLQWQNQNNNNLPGTNTIPFVPNYNTNTIGFFGIESYTSGKTTYEGGIRFDWMNLNVRGRDINNSIYRDNLQFQNFTFTLGFLKQYTKTLSIRTNLGTAWRAPNVNELYSFGKHQSIIEYGLWRYSLTNNQINTNVVLTNDDKSVKSERGLKWITHIQWKGSNSELEVTPYLNWIQNYFYLRPYGLTNTVRGTFPFFIHDQTDAIYGGMDVDIRRQLNSNIEMELKASYVYARDISRNQSFVGIPPFNLQLNLSKSFHRFTIEVSPEWTARQTNAPRVIAPELIIQNTEVIESATNFDFLEAPKGFFLLHSSVSYDWKQLAFKVRFTNILNESYRRYTDNLRYFADDLGRNLGVFLTYSI